MKYLAAAQLQITPEERKALLKVKAFLKRIPPVADPDSRIGRADTQLTQPSPARFNMSRSIAPYACGTGACVGGWMSLSMQGVKLQQKVQLTSKMQRTAISYVDDYMAGSLNAGSPLSRLFYPRTTTNYDALTPAQAVTQITLFLTTGKATW